MQRADRTSYELQVADGHRGKGLARTLMRCLRSLADAFALEKVMLTVFERASTSARLPH